MNTPLDQMQKIRFAIVGCGHIGKRHAAIIINNPECELVALCDIADNAILGTDFNDIPFFSSLELLLGSDLAFDVLAIATPTGLHETHALMGIRAGHHVIIEKPMALNKRGCEKILYEALNKRKEVFCVMQNRYSPPVKWLREIVQTNTLGDIFIVQLNCYWNRNEQYYHQASWRGTKELDGGTLFTQFSHFIDILYWIFGDVQNITGKLKNFNHGSLIEFEDSGIFSFELQKGGIGSINFSTSAWNQNFESSITVLAEKGSVRIGGQYMNTLETCNIKDYPFPVLQASGVSNDYGSYQGSAANHQFVYENVVDVLKKRGSITTNALEGMKVVEIIQKFYAADSGI